LPKISRFLKEPEIHKTRRMLKFSLLGYGHIGKVHKQAIEETIGAELVSIIDINIKKDDVDLPIYTSLEDFLDKDQETDVVVIATPNGMHKGHAIQCMEGGKHVLIEKPIALNSVDAKEIMAAAERTGKRVFSSMQLRFSPPVSFVKNLLENNSLGKIFMVNIHCYWNRNKNYYMAREWHGSNEMDGGVLFTQFSHFIDIINYWFEETKCTNASFYNFNHQGITEFADSGKLDFTADEAVGSMIFTTSIYEKNFKSGIEIIAEKGTIEIGDQYLNEVKFSNLKNVVCSQNLSTEVRNFHPKAIEEIVNAISENRPSALDGKYAIRLVEFIEGAHQIGAGK
jgi:UDP-N-acetyl-2-amino-2-deoxyglucuronate dehydrogenase